MSDVCNTITVEFPFKELYQWACLLTTEQEEQKYFPDSTAKMLLRRLLSTKGNLIAVIGLQGSGKTALRQWLHQQLFNVKKHAYSAKWTGENQQELTRNIENVDDFDFEGNYDENYLEELKSALFQAFGWGVGVAPSYNKILNQLFKKFKRKLSESQIYTLASWLSGREDVAESDVAYIVPIIEKFLDKSKVNTIRQKIIEEKIATSHTLLIDFPDYDKTNRAQMIRDLQNFQSWWEKNVASYEGYTQQQNIVIFFQKELFSGHFTFGKFDVVELKPWTAQQFVEVVDQNFKHPFTREALAEVAALSNGIWRRYKKYIRICLDRAMDEHCNTITLEHVKKWISLDQIVKDMDLELMDMFPKQRELRRKAVLTLNFIRGKNRADQPTITEEIFDGNKMQASRVLNTLEAYGYLTCHYENRVKVWEVKKWKEIE